MTQNLFYLACYFSFSGISATKWNYSLITVIIFLGCVLFFFFFPSIECLFKTAERSQVLRNWLRSHCLFVFTFLWAMLKSLFWNLTWCKYITWISIWLKSRFKKFVAMRENFFFSVSMYKQVSSGEKKEKKRMWSIYVFNLNFNHSGSK